MKTNIVYICTLLICLLGACKEENPLHPFGPNDHAAPREVSNIRIVSKPGGAVLKYDVPDDADLSYVKAEYQNTQGAKKEVRASAYVDSLVISGLGTTDAYEVRLYAVDKQENSSSGVVTTIKPLTPSVWTVKESLKFSVDFGGFVVDYLNPSGDDLAIYALVKDQENKFTSYDALYTSQKKGRYTVRNLPNEENTFGLYVRDRYDNMSDTLFFTETPWREDMLNKKLFQSIMVAGDVRFDFYESSPTEAWDDEISNTNYAHTDFPVEFPHRTTIDLGVDVKLSRFRFWQRPGFEVLYQHGAPKRYRVYGRSDKPVGGSASDPLKDWVLLLECNSFKPSGLPLAQNSGEDEVFAARGEEFSFPRDISAIRYIRFEMLESWSGMKCSTIGELCFWGEILNTNNK